VTGVCDETTIAAFVLYALRQQGRSGAGEILQWLCKRFGAYCAILWQPVPGPQPPQHLFVRAAWFPGRFWSRHDLPMDRSLAGEAIREQRVLQALRDDPRVNSDDHLITDHGIRRICAIPVEIGVGGQGALVLLRQDPEEFSSPELVQSAKLTPALHDAIRRTDQFRLIDDVKAALQRAETGSSKIEDVCQTVCELVAAHYTCIETSIFLQRMPHSTGQLENVGATFPKFVHRSIYTSRDPGITGYVISRRQAVAVLDLCSLGKEQDYITVRYPGLKWTAWIDPHPIIREELGLKDDQPDPPVSYMGAPILYGETTLGVIRCCGLRQLPFYFSDDDLNVLEIVASQLGQLCQRHLAQMELQEEIEVWRRHSEAVYRLNRVVQRELRRPEIREKPILDACLREIAEVFPRADILDIQLIDKGALLSFAATRGGAWSDGPDQEVSVRLSTKYSVNNPPDSAASWAYQNQKVYMTNRVESDPYVRKLFRGMRGVIVAPISLRGERYGVLGICTTSEIPFPGYFAKIAGLMGQQLGLYLHLARTISEQKTTKKELDTVVRVQNESYENLRHQINSPLELAYARCLGVFETEQLSPRMNTHLLAIRGLVGKARQVGRALNVFVKLAENKPLELKPAPLTSEFAFKTALEACEDNRRRYEKRRLQFRIERDSFDVLGRVDAAVDPGLFQQAVNNVVDNAFKYSYAGTVIDVRLMMEGDFVAFSVSNRGLEVRREDIPRLKRRGERGERARLASGEGAGLGWWLVDNIMAAHNGVFDVQPTNAEGRAEVSLRFPVPKRRS
jgi:signal transduction histidine kinase